MIKIRSRISSWKSQLSRSSISVDSPLAAPVQLEKCDDNGRRPIHDACLSGDMIRTRYLLEQGVDVNVLTSDGRTALHLATITQNVAIVTLLLRQQNILGEAFDSCSNLNQGSHQIGISTAINSYKQL